MVTRPTMALAAPKSTEIMPGTVLRGRMYNSSGKVSEGNEMESKYHYLMNWGSQLIGVNKYTRAQFDYHVALAWEHDHWYVRCLKAAVDAAPLIGEMGAPSALAPLGSTAVRRLPENVYAETFCVATRSH